MLLTERKMNQIKWRRAVDFLRNETGGRIFSAYFKKKDGTMREMICRRGVKAHLSGGKLPYDSRAKLLLPVFDMQKEEYRMVNLRTLVSFNIATDPQIGSETFILV